MTKPASTLTRQARPLPARRGFVLPITVILLALISVGVALMSHRSDQLRSLVVASRQEQQAAVAVQDNLALAMYLTSTLYRRGSRLGDIELDGRFYRSSDGSYVSYQDAGGLFNLSKASGPELAALLRAFGVAGNQAIALADALLDYVDSDSLVRVNGAEAAEYAAAKLPPPRNASMLSATELQRIAGWREVDDATLRALLDHVYIGPLNVINRHTVKAPVLAAIGGIDVDTSRDLLVQRASGKPLAIESLPSVARGSYLAAGRFAMLPSTTTLLTICPPAVAWCQHVGLTATAEGESPWHVDFSHRRMRTTPLPPASQVVDLPDQPPKQAPAPLTTPFGNLQ